ncbi:MAG: undecaprenyl-phosphate glucose phosphotransferase [Pseudomonadota bacterium]
MGVQATSDGFATATPASSALRPAWSRQVAIDLVAALDCLMVAIGAALPAFIFAHYGELPIKPLEIAQTGLIAALIVNFCLRAWQFYDPRRIHRIPIEPPRIALAMIIAFTASLGLGLPFDAYGAPMLVWYLTWLAMSFVLILANRMIAHQVLRRFAIDGRFDTRISVYGAGVIARRVSDFLQDGPDGLNFVGVYDDRAAAGRVNDEGLTVRGSIDDLISAGRKGEIDQVIIALPQSADRRVAQIARRLEQLPVSLHVVTHMASDLVDPQASHQVSSLGPLGLLDVKANPHADWRPILKRAEDIVLASFFLVVLAPVFLAIAAAIKFDSNGPVLFKQRRRGLNLSVFDVLKFRTMHVLEDDETVVQATPEDDRVTRVGRFLRRTSLDELPQLWNVLTGEMSLVGPRPHAVVHDDAWSDILSRYVNRAQVKPGITGLAQISGARGQISADDDLVARVERDLEYIANWSVLLDLKIILQTIWAVALGRNAH